MTTVELDRLRHGVITQFIALSAALALIVIALEYIFADFSTKTYASRFMNCPLDYPAIDAF